MQAMHCYLYNNLLAPSPKQIFVAVCSEVQAFPPFRF